MLSLTLFRAHDARRALPSVHPITFPRAKRVCLELVAIATLSLCGCAPAKPLILQPKASISPVGSAYATVTIVRPIRAFAGSGVDPQAAILTAMRGSPSGSAARGSSSEIVVRTDGGGTLSVVQPDSADLAPGERVIVVPGGLTRLVPVPPRS